MMSNTRGILRTDKHPIDAFIKKTEMTIVNSQAETE